MHADFLLTRSGLATAITTVAINVTDNTDPTVNGSDVETVNFNGLHFQQCSQSGINTAANCQTQGTVNTTTTTSVTYMEAGAGAAGKNLFNGKSTQPTIAIGAQYTF